MTFGTGIDDDHADAEIDKIGAVSTCMYMAMCVYNEKLILKCKRRNK